MHGFCLPPPIIMGKGGGGGIDLKTCQNFVGAEFFLTYVGDKPRWRELKLFGGFNIYFFTFIISFI